MRAASYLTTIVGGGLYCRHRPPAALSDRGDTHPIYCPARSGTSSLASTVVCLAYLARARPVSRPRYHHHHPWLHSLCSHSLCASTRPPVAPGILILFVPLAPSPSAASMLCATWPGSLRARMAMPRYTAANTAAHMQVCKRAPARVLIVLSIITVRRVPSEEKRRRCAWVQRCRPAAIPTPAGKINATASTAWASGISVGEQPLYCRCPPQPSHHYHETQVLAIELHAASEQGPQPFRADSGCTHGMSAFPFGPCLPFRLLY
ncbi:hypothetical protein Q7P37_007930 [Cladosporium fusiforme]